MGDFGGKGARLQLTPARNPPVRHRGSKRTARGARPGSDGNGLAAVRLQAIQRLNLQMPMIVCCNEQIGAMWGVAWPQRR
jgi:hypothetical protein